MTKIIANAFSLQMVAAADLPRVRFEPVERPADLSAYESAVGHQDTAAVLGVACNRSNVRLTDGVELVVAQLQGGRLPEGSTTLPEGFTFTFIKAYLA
jgi:hypothetical protein